MACEMTFSLGQAQESIVGSCHPTGVAVPLARLGPLGACQVTLEVRQTFGESSVFATIAKLYRHFPTAVVPVRGNLHEPCRHQASSHHTVQSAEAGQ